MKIKINQLKLTQKYINKWAWLCSNKRQKQVVGQIWLMGCHLSSPELEERLNMLSRDTEDIFQKTQIKLLDMKTIMSEKGIKKN